LLDFSSEKAIMPIDIDPENNETRALLDFAGDLTGRRVLEIGCGEGRLTWRYASLTAHVTAIDPNSGKIARANADLPLDLKERVVFQACELETFAAGLDQDPRFDLAILSWSL
jgi:2-polyprenyl-3-methyl-5-hydroxy-6-metoxy-1,4-benzoquinol methylase